MINFNEELHRYTNNSGQVYTSATQFIDKFVTPFEDTKQFWLYYKAVQYLSNINKPEKINNYSRELDFKIDKTYFSKQRFKEIIAYAMRYCNKNAIKLLDFLDEREQKAVVEASFIIDRFWNKGNAKSKIKGTDFHNWKEGVQIQNKSYTYEGVSIPVYTNSTYNLGDLTPMTYTEMKLWNDKYRLAGTSDQVIILPNRKAIIRDWKTNKEIKVENKYQKMKPPVSHLDDCNLNHYTLQLSLYAWMLEQFGYEVVHMEFEHFTLQEDTPNEYSIVGNKVYQVPYLKQEIQAMLDYGL